MSKMWRYKTDGTVEPCDDTPDVDTTVKKYQRSKLHEGRWVCLHADENNWWTREYVLACEVPKIVKMMDLLDP